MKYGEELEDRRVLVTGAGGFIGSHLIDSLVKQGAEVIAFVKSTSKGQLKNLENSKDEIKIIRGEIQDPISIRKAVRELEGYNNVLVFHLAAQAHVGDSWDRPYETVKTNVLGTLNLLEAIKNQDIGVEKINIAGTSEEYGNFDEDRKEGYDVEENSITLDEGSPVNPKSVYATSKVAADFLAQNYWDAYNLPTITTRMFNNYGPRQSPRYITGTVITQALERGFVEVGNLESKRDLCFVRDGVRGHIAATVEGSPGEVYTFGSGKTCTMRQWVDEIIEVGKEEGYWREVRVVQKEERYRPGDTDVEELKANYSKLNDLTGWKPKTTKGKGLKRTIEWYSQNRENWKGLCDWE